MARLGNTFVMANSQPPPPNAASPRPPRRLRTLAMPWRALVLSMLVYAISGLLLVAFYPPYWVWPMALAGTLMQCLALAGPQALQLLSRAKAWWAVRLSCLGAGLLLVALGIAVGYGGPDDIDAISLQQTATTIAGSALGTFVLTFICAFVSARAGDRLVSLHGRGRSSLMLAGVCFSGLFLGGLIGMAAIPQS